MQADKMIGRQREYHRLDRCLTREEAQLIILYGRRRVGKTYLINTYFEGRFDFKLTGIYNEPREVQLRNFADELHRQTGKDQTQPRDWMEAFGRLRDYLESLPDTEKQIVFLDEMPWMDTPRGGFLPSFEWFWNGFGSARKNLILIVCGSATSWMAEKITGNKGGLFHRQTGRIFLEPFTLGETESYLRSRGINWSRYDIAECYMVMGGIPYYLSLLDPEYSYRENIDSLFFRKRAELWDEFDHLYHTLFTNSDQHIRIAEALNEKKRGMTRCEIAKKTGLAENGALSKMIQNLTDSGFVRAYSFYRKKKKETLYQLADYYSLFYFRFLKDRSGKDEHFWRNAIDSPSRRAWAGLTFEQLCKDHIRQIKQKLGIAGVLSEESTWFIREKDTHEDEHGAQIDLLISRRDHVTNLCEIKFSVNEYEIDKDDEANLRNKIAAFQKGTGSKDTLALTMITTYGVKKNLHSSIVNSQVVLEDLFV